MGEVSDLRGGRMWSVCMREAKFLVCLCNIEMCVGCKLVRILECGELSDPRGGRMWRFA